MKAVLEADDGLPAGERAGRLDRVLDRLRPAVQEEGPLGVIARGERVQPLGQRDIGLVARHREADVEIAVELLADRVQHRGMAVPDVDHADPAAEVDEPIAVHVGKHGALGVGNRDGRDGGDASRHRLRAAREQGLAFRPRNRGLEADHAGHSGLGG